VEWLTGAHSVREALRAHRRELRRLRVEDVDDADRGIRGEIVALARAAGVPVEQASTGQRRGEASPGQGVALEVGPLPEDSLAGLLASRAETPRWIVALDGVEDPQNLGAIARVADAAGAAGLLLTQRRAPPLSPAVSRASAGAIEHLPVARVPNLSRALEDLKARGFWIVGADAGGGEDLFGLADRLLEGDLAIVLGAEGRGIRPGIASCLDHRVRIPMRGAVASLNVSAAAAVVLFELVRRRRS
jgi:23S rRNA (guanosine2251-2'-O)-methyltransferase